MAWNRSSAEDRAALEKASRAAASGRFGWRGLVAGLIVVAGVGAAVVYLLGGDADRKRAADEKKPARIKDVAPAPVVQKTSGQQIKEIIVARGGSKNLTPEDKAKIAELRKESAAKLPMPPAPGFRSPFRHQSDQVIAMVLTSGERVPPFPGTEESLNKSFVQSIMDPIVINEDDSERLKELKRQVMEARQAIKAGIKEGKSVRQVLEEYRQQKESDFEARREVRKMAKEMVASGEGEMAGEFVDRANEKLAERGIDPVSKPLTQEEYRERARQRMLSKQSEEEKK